MAWPDERNRPSPWTNDPKLGELEAGPTVALPLTRCGGEGDWAEWAGRVIYVNCSAPMRRAVVCEQVHGGRKWHGHSAQPNPNLHFGPTLC